jgi:excinuclease ABC subunit A
MTKKIESLSPKDYILIKKAELHNLKGIDMAIPRNKLVVITGLSGSGKSTIAFDTLYAEGQRRYVESLSSYARQFLGKLNKPKVEYIKGIAPAIAIEQKVNTSNSRSTVGTSTEIYDYLKLLFARIGKTYSPISGNEVKRQTVKDVISYIKTLVEGEKLLLLAPKKITDEQDLSTVLKLLQQQGFARVILDNKLVKISDVISSSHNTNTLQLVVDRVVVKNNEDFYNRLADAIQNTFFEGNGTCLISDLSLENVKHFSNKFELDNIVFTAPSTHLFSFNNSFGACSKCEGFGSVIGIDESLVIPNTSLSVYEDAIMPWRSPSYKSYKNPLIENAFEFDFPIHKPYHKLTVSQKQLLWEGNEYFEGINLFFKHIEEKIYKIQNRVLLSRYRGKTLCDVCSGKRLRKEASYVKIAEKSINDLVILPLDELIVFFNDLKLNEYDFKVAKRLLIEIKNRLSFLNNVGLSYLTLNRASRTLSGGESQRINLATSLGSSLVGSMYILDEPSIGLHPKDTENLITVLKHLRDLGNTVIVVEHDEQIMKAADYIFDIGPEAGLFGGEIVSEGTFDQMLKTDTLTARYLKKELEVTIPKRNVNLKEFISIKGARANNLKNIDVSFPLNVFTVVTGVSGSGKSSLVKEILYPALQKKLNNQEQQTVNFDGLEGAISKIQHVEFVDQNPIGRSSRSNPATYIKAYDEIRDLFSKQKLAKINGYKPKHFSFNTDGGRCEVCKGEGEVTIEMQFMADVKLQCETCKGQRFKKEVLEVKVAHKNIFDILSMNIDEAVFFFREHAPKVAKKLQPLLDVGLGYLQLGQSSSTLSGGEAQRIKLASFLSKGNKSAKTVFIFDEPTTGLHFHDVNKLLQSFYALLNNGHTVIVIEHNTDLIKNADYIIDLGVSGGVKGGELLYQGVLKGLGESKIAIIKQFL